MFSDGDDDGDDRRRLSGSCAIRLNAILFHLRSIYIILYMNWISHFAPSKVRLFHRSFSMRWLRKIEDDFVPSISSIVAHPLSLKINPVLVLFSLPPMSERKEIMTTENDWKRIRWQSVSIVLFEALRNREKKSSHPVALRFKVTQSKQS